MDGNLLYHQARLGSGGPRCSRLDCSVSKSTQG